MHRNDTAAQHVADLAIKDLARRLGVSAREVRVVQVAAVQWPDASLGCPEKGKVYAAVVTPGYRIELEYAADRHLYHADRDRVKYCPGGCHCA